MVNIAEAMMVGHVDIGMLAALIHRRCYRLVRAENWPRIGRLE